MIETLKNAATTIGIAVGSVFGGNVIAEYTAMNGVYVTIAIFILGIAWKQAKWQQKVDDSLTTVLKHQQWQLDNHSILSENQKKLEQKINGLPCDTEKCISNVNLIGHPQEL